MLYAQTNIPSRGSKVYSAQRFCDGLSAAGPLKYALKAFLISVAPFEDRLNDLQLTFVLA